MQAKNKYVAIIVALIIGLVASIATMVIVLVIANQTATSAVNVKYTASEVSVDLSANAYVGNNSTTVFTSNGSPTGESTITLSPDSQQGSLSQPSNTSSINLNKTNDTIVFEYIFKNNSDDINCVIELTSFPGKTEGVGISDNIELSYYFSDTQVDNMLGIVGSSDFPQQLLPAYEGETTYKYIYIVASIDNYLYDATLQGEFAFGLTKPQDSDIITYTLNISGADYVERDSTAYSHTSTTDNPITTMKHSVIKNTVVTVDDIDVYPSVANKAFVGWSLTDGGSLISYGMNENATDSSKVESTPLTAGATLYPVYKNGSIEDQYYVYNLNNNSYEISSELTSHSASEVVIPDTYYNSDFGFGMVTTISEDVLSNQTNNANITKLTFGRYLNNFHHEALKHLTKVTEINYNSKAVSDLSLINDFLSNAGKESTGITLNIDKGVTLIPAWIFDSVTLGHEKTFNQINFYNNSSCKSIGDRAFAFNYINSITLPNSVVTIDDGAFTFCQTLQNVVFPTSLSTIGNSAFNVCDLQELVLPEGLTSIGEQSFSSNNLTSVYISANINSIGKQCFSENSNLTAITVSGRNSVYDSRYGCNAIIETATNKLIFACSTTTIHSTVTRIGSNAFYNCTNLTNLYIHANITNISLDAFYGCKNLTSIEVDPNNTKYDSRDNCNAIISKRNNSLVVGCKTSFIPNTVTKISDNAFYGLSGLKTITIPQSVEYIGYDAFYGSGITEVIFEDTTSIWVDGSGDEYNVQTDNMVRFLKTRGDELTKVV